MTAAVMPQSMDRRYQQILCSRPNMIVKQTRRGWAQELCCNCEANQEYIISDVESPNEMAMYAAEDSTCCTRSCCGTNRPFHLRISEQKKSERLLTYKRPLRCVKGSCCYVQEISTWDGDSYLGKTTIPFYWCTPKLVVHDKDDNEIYKIAKEGMCSCVILDFCKADFTIKDMNNAEVGRVAKLQSGILKEMFTDADTFQVDFPIDANGEIRALLFGSTFLLDMNFFESDQKKHDGNDDDEDGDDDDDDEFDFECVWNCFAFFFGSSDSSNDGDDG